MGLLNELLKSTATRNLERIAGPQATVRAQSNGVYHVWAQAPVFRANVAKRLDKAGVIYSLSDESPNLIRLSAEGKRYWF